MKHTKLLLLPIFLISIQSCKDLSNPIIPFNDNFIYPLKIGNKWNYNASSEYSNITPDSIKYLFTNESIDLQVSVTRDTILNTIKVYEMKEEGYENSVLYGYYSNEEEGFFKYAYNGGGSSVLPKTKMLKRFIYKDYHFNSISDFINQQIGTLNLSKKTNDTIIFFEQPRMIYSYPFEIGKEWIFSPNIVKINKEVIGKETVYTTAGVFECYKIQWKFDFNLDGVFDDDFIYYEYVCSKGLLKTIVTMKNIKITSEENPDSIGHVDLKYERTLTGSNF
jgi:hypothetical protein